MVYRDAPGDMRTAELRSLVASEPELQDAARQLRFEQDGANEEVDRLGRELAAVERDIDRARGGGLRALFARGAQASAAAEHVLRDALDDAMARLDDLIAQEGLIRAQLDAVTAARAELAAREADAAETLRAADNPAGADYRAIDAAIAREDGRLAALEQALRAIERADVAIAAVLRAGKDTAEAGGGLSADALSVHARIRDSATFAMDVLARLERELDDLAFSEPVLIGRLPRRELRPFITAAQYQSIELSALVARAQGLASDLSTMLTEVAGERDRIRARRGELSARQRDAEARLLAGDATASEVA